MAATAAVTADTSLVAQSPNRSRFRWAISDTMAITGRNITTLWRVPQLLVFVTIQPVLFVLLFRYVFGGAINVPGVPYVDFLMPGIFIQTVAFGATNTGVGLAEDLHKGLIERFRSLPMARSAVLAGRTCADLVRNIFVVTLMLMIGFIVGFRLHTNLASFIGGVLIILLFAFSFSWIFALIGLSAKTAESAQAASFPPMIVLVFASSTFVPIQSMPGWLQAFAKHQPVTLAVNAVRALMIGGPTTSYVVRSILWSVAIIAVFAPIAVRRYRRAAD